jgi:hypothetical protein
VLHTKHRCVQVGLLPADEAEEWVRANKGARGGGAAGTPVKAAAKRPASGGSRAAPPAKKAVAGSGAKPKGRPKAAAGGGGSSGKKAAGGAKRTPGASTARRVAKSEKLDWDDEESEEEAASSSEVRLAPGRWGVFAHSHCGRPLRLLATPGALCVACVAAAARALPSQRGSEDSSNCASRSHPGCPCAHTTNALLIAHTQTAACLLPVCVRVCVQEEEADSNSSDDDVPLAKRQGKAKA